MWKLIAADSEDHAPLIIRLLKKEEPKQDTLNASCEAVGGSAIVLTIEL
jgi:hypothetical protein